MCPDPRSSWTMVEIFAELMAEPKMQATLRELAEDHGRRVAADLAAYPAARADTIALRSELD